MLLRLITLDKSATYYGHEIHESKSNVGGAVKYSCDTRGSEERASLRLSLEEKALILDELSRVSREEATGVELSVEEKMKILESLNKPTISDVTEDSSTPVESNATVDASRQLSPEAKLKILESL